MLSMNRELFPGYSGTGTSKVYCGRCDHKLALYLCLQSNYMPLWVPIWYLHPHLVELANSERRIDIRVSSVSRGSIYKFAYRRNFASKVIDIGGVTAPTLVKYLMAESRVPASVRFSAQRNI